MKFSSEDRKLVTKIKNIIFKNATNNVDLLNQLKLKANGIEYNYLDEETSKFFQSNSSLIAYYCDFNKNVILRPHLENNYNKMHVLMHEMCHAFSHNGNDVGFRKVAYHSISKKNMDVKDVIATKKSNSAYIIEVKNNIINEAATEFYATKFLNLDPICYLDFVPIYKNFSDVCGYEKLKDYYFNNDFDGLISTIQEGYHLQDDYLIKKLFMLLDISFEDDIIYAKILRCAYEVYLDININKVLHEHKDINSISDIKKYIDISKLLACKDSNEVDEQFKYIVDFMESRLNNFDKVKKDEDIETTKRMLHILMCYRSNNQDESEIYTRYKNYFKRNFADVLTCLNQSTYFVNFDGAVVDPKFTLKSVLEFILSFKDEIDMNKMSKSDVFCVEANLSVISRKLSEINKDKETEKNDKTM